MTRYLLLLRGILRTAVLQKTPAESMRFPQYRAFVNNRTLEKNADYQLIGVSVSILLIRIDLGSSLVHFGWLG